MVKSIKGFNHDWTCLGFQYEVGKTYELPEGTLVMPCYHGFHAVDAKNPLSVFFVWARKA